MAITISATVCGEENQTRKNPGSMLRLTSGTPNGAMSLSRSKLRPSLQGVVYVRNRGRRCTGVSDSRTEDGKTDSILELQFSVPSQISFIISENFPSRRRFMLYTLFLFK